MFAAITTKFISVFRLATCLRTTEKKTTHTSHIVTSGDAELSFAWFGVAGDCVSCYEEIAA